MQVLKKTLDHIGTSRYHMIKKNDTFYEYMKLNRCTDSVNRYKKVRNKLIKKNDTFYKDMKLNRCTDSVNRYNWLMYLKLPKGNIIKTFWKSTEVI